LAGVNGPWLRQKLGISVLIKTGPAAKRLSRQQHNMYHFVSLMMNISGAKNTALIFLEIFFIQYLIILVGNIMTSSLP